MWWRLDIGCLYGAGERPGTSPVDKTGLQGALTLNSDVLVCRVSNAYPVGFLVLTLKAEPL